MNKRILLMPSPPVSGSLGSTIKFIGLANELVNNGATVAMAIVNKFRNLINNSTFKVYEICSPINQRTYKNIESYVDFIEWAGMADPDYLKQAIAEGSKIVFDFRPDLILAQSNPAASIVALREKVPLYQFASSPSWPSFHANSLRDGVYCENINSYTKCRNIFVNNICELTSTLADKILVPSIPELEPMLSETKTIAFCGAVLNNNGINKDEPDITAQLDERPLIFIYTSVGAMPPRLYQRIVCDTFKDTDWNVICCMGLHFDYKDIKPHQYDNIVFTQYANIRPIISRCSLVLFHGGQDMMLNGILHKKPLLAMPGHHFEREFNLQQIVKTGVGCHLSVLEFRPSKLLRRIEKTLKEVNNFKLAELSNEIKKFDEKKVCLNILLGNR